MSDTSDRDNRLYEALAAYYEAANPDRAAVLDGNPDDPAILHDIDAALGRSASIAPDHGVVARRAAARLEEAAV